MIFLHSSLMAEYLTFLESKSAAFIFKNEGVVSFADENFAREILQVKLCIIHVNKILFLD